MTISILSSNIDSPTETHHENRSPIHTCRLRLMIAMQKPLPVQQHQGFCLLQVMRIVRAKPLPFATASAGLLLPCFWQKQIEAGDLLVISITRGLFRRFDRETHLGSGSVGNGPTSYLIFFWAFSLTTSDMLAPSV